jgi:folate-binding Fe-S cluster repair protein YgfZ
MAQNIISLSERGLISIGGSDALKFLQDLVTADVDGLAIGHAHYAGLLTPQGKILYDFFIVREEQGYLIDCVAEQRDELIKRLNFYKLRAKLDVRPDERHVGAALDEPAEGAVRDPRSADMAPGRRE